MPFVPNDPGSGDPIGQAHAALFAAHLDALAAGPAGTGVVSGCGLSLGSGLQIVVAAGVIRVATARIASIGATVTAVNNAILPRWAIVTTNGTPLVTMGTAAALPDMPAIPAGHVLLGAAYIPAGLTTLTSVHLNAATRVAVPPALTTTRGDLIVRGPFVDERLPIGAAGTILTSDGVDAVWGTGGGTVAKRQAADAASSLATPTELTNLSLVIPNSVDSYAFDFRLFVGCSGAGGVKFQMGVPFSFSQDWYATAFGVAGSLTSFVTDMIDVKDTLGTAFVTFASQDGFVRITGSYVGGSSNGTISVHFAAGVAGQTATIRKHSSVVYSRLP